MIIGVCGFSSSGSSAAIDFLKEFEENQVMDDYEFIFPYFPDGLNDLIHNLTENSTKYMSSNVAIERYRRFIRGKGRVFNKKATNGELFRLTDEFLDKIVQVRWKGCGGTDTLLDRSIIRRYVGTYFMRRIIIPQLEKVFKRNIYVYPVRMMEFSANPQNLNEITRKYIEDILNAMGSKPNKNIVLNQPFPGNNPANSFAYFNDPVSIVVDRDPRDNYIFAKKFLLHKGLQIPTDSVENFVIYYRNMRKNMPYKIENARILNINFEDMVYEYEGTKKKIMEFCKLKNHTYPKKIFVPEMSMNNTQVFRRYPGYEKDIKYIEKDLNEYLFPFEKYDIRNDFSRKMFYGKSPLNK